MTYQGYLDHGLGDIVSRYVARGADGYTTVGYVEVGSADDLARAARGGRVGAGAEVTLTGVPVVNAALAARFRTDSSCWAMAVGSVVVFLLILITFRKRRSDVSRAVADDPRPDLGGGAARAAGVSLDLFSVFAVLTLIGIGVDYGIHLVHRAATEPAQLDLALARVAPANIVAAGIALLGCGSLAVSTYPPLRSLGIVTVVGLCTCLVAAVLVLPAMLMVTSRSKR